MSATRAVVAHSAGDAAVLFGNWKVSERMNTERRLEERA
jgi:hypothetical protein